MLRNPPQRPVNGVPNCWYKARNKDIVRQSEDAVLTATELLESEPNFIRQTRVLKSIRDPLEPDEAKSSFLPLKDDQNDRSSV